MYIYFIIAYMFIIILFINYRNMAVKVSQRMVTPK